MKTSKTRNERVTFLRRVRERFELSWRWNVGVGCLITERRQQYAFWRVIYFYTRARARERSFKPASPLCFDLFKDLVQKLKDWGVPSGSSRLKEYVSRLHTGNRARVLFMRSFPRASFPRALNLSHQRFWYKWNFRPPGTAAVNVSLFAAKINCNRRYVTSGFCVVGTYWLIYFNFDVCVCVYSERNVGKAGQTRIRNGFEWRSAVDIAHRGGTAHCVTNDWVRGGLFPSNC